MTTPTPKKLDAPVLQRWEETLHEKYQQLLSLQEELNQLPEQRVHLYLRYKTLEEQQDRFPDEFAFLQRIWTRLQADPNDYLLLAMLDHYQQGSQKNIEDRQRMWQDWPKTSTKEDHTATLLDLRQHIQAWAWNLVSWNKVANEIRYRLHLLQILHQRLTPLEPQLQPSSEELSAVDLAPPSNLSLDDPTLQRFDAQQSTPAHDERRQSTRHDLGITVQIGMEEASFYTGFSENISSGGLFVATFDMDVSLGDQLELQFTMPDQSLIRAHAQVAWLREYNPQIPDLSPGFGLRFLDLSPQDEKKINRYIAKEGSMFYEQ